MVSAIIIKFHHYITKWAYLIHKRKAWLYSNKALCAITSGWVG